MNHEPLAVVGRLSDKALLTKVKQLVVDEHHSTATLVAYLAELDRRKLYLAEGFPSLFAYCVDALHLSEGVAYGRIRAARAATQYPVILSMLTTGEVNPTNIALIAPHLTKENHLELLAVVRHQRKRKVLELVARLQPLPDVPSSIRRLPAPKSSVFGTQESSVGGAAAAEDALFSSDATSAGGDTVSLDVTSAIENPRVMPSQALPPARPAVVAPLAPERYRFEFTGDKQIYESFLRAQALLRDSIPDGDPAAIMSLALGHLVEHLEKKKFARTDRPRANGTEGGHSKYIPASLRRAVLERDQARCTFTSPDGQRCEAEGFLQVDHVRPRGAGGETTLENLRVLCRAHNHYVAEQFFGQEKMQSMIAAAKKKRAKRIDEMDNEQPRAGP